MKHIVRPYEEQRNTPVDMNDFLGAMTAIEVRFPETFSDKAKKVIKYFDDTIFLYAYKGKFVVTDESLYLTEHGDGSADAPLGGPRWTGDNLEELESWLESVADDYDKYGDMEGWESEHKKSQAVPRAVPPNVTFWLIIEMLYGFASAVYCVKTRKQAEAAMEAFIDNYMLRKEALTCVYAKEQLSCVDENQSYTFSARKTASNGNPPWRKQAVSDPYHLHPLPLYDVCMEAAERGFSTIFDVRTLIHTPLNEFAEDINAADYDDAYGYVRFGNIIVGLSDVWETEAEIYELE